MNDLHLLVSWILPILVFALFLGFFFVLKRILVAKLLEWAKKTEVEWDDVLVSAANVPLNFLIVVLSLWIARYFVNLPPELSPYIAEAGRLFIILSALLFCDRFLVGIVSLYARKNPQLQSSQKLTTSIVHVVIFVFVALFVLHAIGVSITPFVASLGIGSAAIALALQDTLVNAFSGMHLLMDRPIAPGHFISLDDGRQGHVETVGWRTTRLRLPSNDTIIIPNSKLASNIITNYDYPEPKTVFKVKLNIHTASDLEKAEKVILEEARKILKEHSSAVSDFEPKVIFQEFSDSGIQLIVILAARHYIDHGAIKSQFIKNLHKRFQQENIIIPYPTRTIYTAK
ncbi:MAG: mechanosensitive ion channel [Deltaproteobacteria bacterium]|nr:mechanosensitive ion channel [Deltaproteobacteria bacterium]MBI3017214.1 mechanosensitive ion channel [Deltaproteobacteria bacterium]